MDPERDGRSNSPGSSGGTYPLTSPTTVAVVGPILALLIAGGLVPLRDTLGVTNVALLIALVVVVAATADRSAGAITAVVAALSYNFFHTQPYRSLRIDNGRDILTVVILLVIGLAVSEISVRTRAAARESRRHACAETALERTSAMLARGASVAEVWEEIRIDLIELLRVEECRYEAGALTTLPEIERSGTLHARTWRWNVGGFELPPEGAAIPVTRAGVVFGQIVLVPRAQSGSIRDERRVAVALADQLAVAIALDSPVRS